MARVRGLHCVHRKGADGVSQLGVLYVIRFGGYFGQNVFFILARAGVARTGVAKEFLLGNLQKLGSYSTTSVVATFPMRNGGNVSAPLRDSSPFSANRQAFMAASAQHQLLTTIPSATDNRSARQAGSRPAIMPAAMTDSK